MSHLKLLSEAFASHGLVFPLDLYYHHILPYTERRDFRELYSRAIKNILRLSYPRGTPLKPSVDLASQGWFTIPVLLEARAKGWPIGSRVFSRDGVLAFKFPVKHPLSTVVHHIDYMGRQLVYIQDVSEDFVRIELHHRSLSPSLVRSRYSTRKRHKS